MNKKSFTNFIVHLLFLLIAFLFNYIPMIRKYMRSTQGWINFSVGFRTENDSVNQAIIFKNGKVSVRKEIPNDIDVTLIFIDDKTLLEMLKITPNEVVNLLLKNKLRTDGNLTYLNPFNFYISLLFGKKHKKMLNKQIKTELAQNRRISEKANTNYIDEFSNRKKTRISGKRVDNGVLYLEDPYLSEYGIDDFPLLKKFLHIHFSTKPEVCPERPKLLTDFFINKGFVLSPNGDNGKNELRQAHAFKYLMENKKPIIRKNDLIAGTSTTKEIGVILYQDAHAALLWGELKSAPDRRLNPYIISDETSKILHSHILPYWMDKNFREWVRKKYNNPLSQQMDERFAVYFLFKVAALSHTILDFPKLLRIGIKGLIREIDDELKKDTKISQHKKDTLAAMRICLEGVTSYAKNLSKQAALEAKEKTDPRRKAELQRLSEICDHVPENPARTLDEAINAIWIGWVALHMENTNAGLSLGRMDQWLQPYYESDIKKIKTKEEQREYIKRAIELVGCFYMRCTDHLPLVPDIGNYLFGGSSSDQAITLGGMTPDGKDAVCDMTYIFLKVTEILAIRDPNVNARFTPGINSDAYLKRLCEVNLITTATPSMHNDHVVMKSLEGLKYKPEDLRDWAATGCVEPTISGKHMGHTNCMMMNMVAALEMALNNGRHPLMRWDVGPRTGRIYDDVTNGGNGDFKKFEDFFEAFKIQFKFLIDQSIEYNNMLGEAHSIIRPTPLLSSLIEGCITTGKDATKGGAKYNSSGSACIGLADVTDSLMVIKKLVYDEKKTTFAQLKEAIDNNFENNPSLHAMVTKKVKLFGSGSEEAVAIANSVTKFAHDTYFVHKNFRGGRYTAGFWSMANHVAFGTLAGALPSGRLAGKAFTPGLTPSPNASNNILDNIRDVAKLDPKNMNNNIAFNVKVVPAMTHSHERTVDIMHSLAKTYFDLGGMQMQLNVVNSDMLKDAMYHPEDYQNLLVRISGYNAYFVTLNKDMQRELIERAEYGI